jgi:hypothetical protein
MSSVHPFDTDLALYSSGDLHGWERIKTAVHVHGCERCTGSVAAFRKDQKQLADSAGALPPGINWDRLAADMSANIRVGLAAGECVAPLARDRKQSSWNWKPAAAFAALALVFGAAWWLNMPASGTATLSKSFFGPSRTMEDRGPVVEASSEGIQSRENGSVLGMSTGETQPVATSVSFGGSASARFVDDATGQVSITTVYVQ